MSKFSEKIAKQFADPIGAGGKVSTFIMNRMNQSQYNQVIRLTKTVSDKRMLDVGFGNGYLIQKVAAQCPNASFYGIEMSPDMVKQASKRNEKLIQQKRLDLQMGDVIKIPFEDDFFQSIYSVNTVYFWGDVHQGMREIYRCLSEGGCFVNAFYDKRWLDTLRYTDYGFTKYTVDELEAITQSIGFKTDIIEIKKDASYCIKAIK